MWRGKGTGGEGNRGRHKEEEEEEEESRDSQGENIFDSGTYEYHQPFIRQIKFMMYRMR